MGSAGASAKAVMNSMSGVKASFGGDTPTRGTARPAFGRPQSNLFGANFPVSCMFWNPRNRRFGSIRATTSVGTGRWSTTSVSRYSADPSLSIVSSSNRLSFSARASSPVLNQAEITPLKVA